MCRQIHDRNAQVCKEHKNARSGEQLKSDRLGRWSMNEWECDEDFEGMSTKKKE